MTGFETDLASNQTSLTRLMRIFTVSSLAVLMSVGGWSVAAKVDSAVVTGGTFVVQSSAQAVQHLEGGVVGAILVKDGQLVQENQVLVRLDAQKVIAETAIQERKLIDLAAQRARLEAEDKNLDQIQVPPPPVPGEQAATAFRLAIAQQQNLLEEKRSTRSSQVSQLQERKRQTESQIDGLRDKLKSLQEEFQQASAELADMRMLESKGLIRRPVLRQSERDVSRLRGDMGDVESRIASAQSQLTETAFKMAEVTRSARSEILSQLSDISAQYSDAEQQRLAAIDRLQRLEIKAPRAGYVQELAIHTVGGIVGPGQTVMSIIPISDALVVSAKVRPDEVDQVHVGQPAIIRVSSLKLPVAPELDGEVTNLSADKVVDAKTGEAYFTVKIAVPNEERHKLHGKELSPGMPAEVLIKGESRRVITYLTHPLTEKIGLAFREE
jgi:HlyD family secretion protein